MYIDDLTLHIPLYLLEAYILLESKLLSLAKELDRIHGPNFSIAEIPFPDFVTTSMGVQRYFTCKARAAVHSIATTIHQNRSRSAVQLEIVAFERVVRQSVADLHSEGAFASPDSDEATSMVDTLKTRIETSLGERGHEYTHHIPAWTQGIEKEVSFSLGPVQFSSRDAWIDQVDFSPLAKDTCGNDPKANRKWKESLRGALEKSADDAHLPQLANLIYNVVRTCPAILTVTVTGYEKAFSGKLARIVCKAALDATSLCFQNADQFRQQALHDERLPPVSTSGIIETNGFLHLPDYKLLRFPTQRAEVVQNTWANLVQFQAPIGAILGALVNPSSHNHPQLASRWATALDWLGEGCRESSDLVALAKLGTSLDVLSSGGKFKGILEMVSHLTGLDKDEQVIPSETPMTLAQVIRNIYDHGRSQILHGNHHDRLKPFQKERLHATQIGISVLLEAALRLSAYDGNDEDKAFRSMSSE